jgi:hypothetical protein
MARRTGADSEPVDLAPAPYSRAASALIPPAAPAGAANDGSGFGGDGRRPAGESWARSVGTPDLLEPIDRYSFSSPGLIEAVQ